MTESVLMAKATEVYVGYVVSVEMQRNWDAGYDWPKDEPRYGKLAYFLEQTKHVWVIEVHQVFKGAPPMLVKIYNGPSLYTVPNPAPGQQVLVFNYGSPGLNVVPARECSGIRPLLDEEYYNISKLLGEPIWDHRYYWNHELMEFLDCRDDAVGYRHSGPIRPSG